MLGKGQIYLPRDGFKRAHSWAEGVVSERVLEAESQQKKVEQLVLNLLFHPQLKQYIRSGIQEDYCIRKISLTPLQTTASRTLQLISLSSLCFIQGKWYALRSHQGNGLNILLRGDGQGQVLSMNG